MMEDMKAVTQTLGEYLPGVVPQFMPAGLTLHITVYSAFVRLLMTLWAVIPVPRCVPK